ncbi:MAG: cobalamin-dependent protein, partial [Actinomycetota bacterium]|nr:cobalamin-dependent protein [Actinomycetota bacterium]
VREWKASRDPRKVEAALAMLAEAAKTGTNIMEPSIALALAGGTTGEWAGTLREVFGEFRAPTGIAKVKAKPIASLDKVRSRARALPGGPPRMLVAKPGLDGHSNGAEQIAVAARDAGFEVIYQGIRLTPAQIANAALEEDVDVVGISILSGSHLELVPEIVNRMRTLGSEAVVVVGGIIPEIDHAALRGAGVAAIYTPKDFEIAAIMDDIERLVAQRRGIGD